MDSHVQKDTAGDFDVFNRRRARVAASNAQDVRLTDFASGDSLAYPPETRVKPAIKAHLKLHACLLDDSQGFVNLRQIEGDGFLAKNMFAGFGGFLANLDVRIG